MEIMNILEQLKQERDKLSTAIAALEGRETGNSRRGRRPGRKSKVAATALPFGAAKPGRKKRKMSAAAKKRISESAKARWAKAKKAGKNSL
jgi:hypothetical protein